jgi:hypothetical protein
MIASRRVVVGMGGTNEGGEEDVGKKGRRKSDGALKRCKNHESGGPPLQGRLRLQHLAANINR